MVQNPSCSACLEAPSRPCLVLGVTLALTGFLRGIQPRSRRQGLCVTEEFWFCAGSFPSHESHLWMIHVMNSWTYREKKIIQVALFRNCLLADSSCFHLNSEIQIRAQKSLQSWDTHPEILGPLTNLLRTFRYLTILNFKLILIFQIAQGD